MTLIQSRSRIDISTDSDGKIADSPNEENLDSIVNYIILELSDTVLKNLSDGDITDIYEASDDN